MWDLRYSVVEVQRPIADIIILHSDEEDAPMVPVAPPPSPASPEHVAPPPSPASPAPVVPMEPQPMSLSASIDRDLQDIFAMVAEHMNGQATAPPVEQIIPADPMDITEMPELNLEDFNITF